MSTQLNYRPLISPIISPQQFDFWAKELGTITAWQRVYARVVARQQENSDTVTLTLKTNRNFKLPRPGQHVSVSATIDGRRVSRCYSLSVLGDKKRHICITVRREPQGLLSNWLNDHAQPGTVLELSQAYGDLADAALASPEHALVFLAAGSGITAIANIIFGLAKLTPSLNGSLLYWERGEDRFCFAPQFEALRKRHPNFNVHFINTDTANTGEIRPSQRISETLLAERAPQLPKAQAFACGSNAFVSAAEQLVTPIAAGFHAESFSPPPQDAALRLSAQPAPEVTVTLRKSGKQLQVSSSKNLLDALEDAGLAVPYGCRAGICNSCSCQQRSGTSLNTLNGLEQQGEQAVRLCVSHATRPLELDI